MLTMSPLYNMYSTGKFAEMVGKSVKTVQRWDREGTLKACRTNTNRRYYTHEQYLEHLGIKATEKSTTVAYCRVSSASQKDDLATQKNYLSDFCRAAGIQIDEWYVDIGSGLNFKRKKFNELLEQIEAGKVKRIILAHRDRLVRFGYDWFEGFCTRHGCEITLINDERLSPQEEIVQDLISIIHVFSCRVYGLRKYKPKMTDLQLSEG